jgi:hypothetical protein
MLLRTCFKLTPMKKKIIAVLVLSCLVALYFFLEKGIATSDQPKTPTELNAIAEAKYFKYEGKPFIINNIEFELTEYKFIRNADSTTLLIYITLKTTQASDTLIHASYFNLLNEGKQTMLAKFASNIEVTTEAKQVTLIYMLPKELNSAASYSYQLHLEATTKPEQKSILPIYKSYRSEG